jgi:hypothetical protein
MCVGSRRTCQSPPTQEGRPKELSREESELVKLFERMPAGQEPDPKEDDDDGLSETDKAILQELEESRDEALECAAIEGFSTSNSGSNSALYKRFAR